jgi:hypothetical protein
MDVVLGVAVTGPRARLALVGAGAGGADVIDESFVDLADNPLRKLTDTVVGTNRLLAGENHRLLATRLCWSDRQEVERLRRALEDSGVHNVAVLSESQASSALSGTGRSASSAQPADDPTVALARGAAMAAGLAGDATAMAPALGLTGDATAMAPTMGWTGDATAMAPTAGLDGDATGMAPTKGWTGDATAMAPAVPGARSAGQVGPQLAYSMAGDSDLLPMEWLTEPDDDAEAKTGPVGLGSRRLAATDAVLGIAVAGAVARLALVGPAGGGYAGIKDSVVDLPVHPFQTLIPTVAGIQRSLAAEGRHLVGVRLCSADRALADGLRQALADAGIRDVAVVSEADAVTALLQTVFRGHALPGAVALVVTAEAATLVALGGAGAAASVLASVAVRGVDAATAAADMLLDWLRSAPFEASAAYVMGTMADLASVADQLRARSPLRVEVLGRPDFAIARGAAMAAGLAPTTPLPPFTPVEHTAMAPATQVAGGATGMAPTAGIAEANAEEPQLAYSEADDAEPFGEMDEYSDEYPGEEDDEVADGAAPLSRRSVLIGNAVIAFAVVGLASLAAAVTIAVRPTSSEQPVVGHQNAAPGKFMPLLPTQQQAPVPPPPPDAPFAGFQGGVIPDANGYIPPQLTGGGGGGPAQSPGGPGLVPNPNGPLPVPYPGWRPPYPGWRPPYPGWPGPSPTTTPPTTTTTPPTTTTTPPTTTTTTTTTPTTTTTTTTTPTTTTTQTTTTTTQPTTTTTQPTTTTTQPTGQAPKVTTPLPTPTAAPQPTPVAPKPTPTAAPQPTPVAPKPTPQQVPQPTPQQIPQPTAGPKPPPVITTPHH